MNLFTLPVFSVGQGVKTVTRALNVPQSWRKNRILVRPFQSLAEKPKPLDLVGITQVLETGQLGLYRDISPNKAGVDISPDRLDHTCIFICHGEIYRSGSGSTVKPRRNSMILKRTPTEDFFAALSVPNSVVIFRGCDYLVSDHSVLSVSCMEQKQSLDGIIDFPPGMYLPDFQVTAEGELADREFSFRVQAPPEFFRNPSHSIAPLADMKNRASYTMPIFCLDDLVKAELKAHQYLHAEIRLSMQPLPNERNFDYLYLLPAA